MDGRQNPAFPGNVLNHGFEFMNIAVRGVDNQIRSGSQILQLFFLHSDAICQVFFP